LTLSQEYIKAGAPASSYSQISGALLVVGNDWVSSVRVLLAWSIDSFMYHYIFFKSRLIPRWLSVLGLIGVPFCITGCLLVMFQVIRSGDTVQTVLSLPLGVQEIPLAIWLRVKEFNSSVIKTKVAFDGGLDPSS